jgi:hypothetical protein
MLEMKNAKDLSKTYIKKKCVEVAYINIVYHSIVAGYIHENVHTSTVLRPSVFFTHGRIDRHHGTHSYKTHYYTPHTY